eukprot:jgi/Bigna1/67565/fgenesh1_pg.4_\
MFCSFVSEGVKETFIHRNDALTRPQKDSKARNAKPWDHAFFKVEEKFNDEEWLPDNPFEDDISLSNLDPSDTTSCPKSAAKLANEWREFRAEWEVVIHNCEKSGQNKSIEAFTRRSDIIFFYRLMEVPGNEELLKSVGSPTALEDQVSGVDFVSLKTKKRPSSGEGDTPRSKRAKRRNYRSHSRSISETGSTSESSQVGFGGSKHDIHFEAIADGEAVIQEEEARIKVAIRKKAEADLASSNLVIVEESMKRLKRFEDMYYYVYYMMEKETDPKKRDVLSKAIEKTNEVRDFRVVVAICRFAMHDEIG